MKAITQDWLNFAETDLQTCKKLINDEFLTNIVAFHAQQTVEKCFKAIIEENDLEVPKIHNLMRLFDIIETLVNYTIDEKMLQNIDTVYIKTRYPGYLGMLPDVKPSLKQSKQLYEFAEEIFRKTKKCLNKEIIN